MKDLNSHKHIPIKHGHVTWTGKKMPTPEQMEAFQVMAEVAVNAMTMKRTNQQNAEMHRLFQLTGQIKYKRELVLAYTYGRHESSKEMTVIQADALIDHLRHRDRELHDKSRNTVRHYLKLLGWSWEKIDGWVQNCGANNPKKKSLNNLGGAALNKVVAQAKAVYNTEISKVK